jgi:hypothetical protein
MNLLSKKFRCLFFCLIFFCCIDAIEGQIRWKKTSYPHKNNSKFESILFIKAFDNIIYSGSISGLFKSTDDGETWIKISPENIKGVNTLIKISNVYYLSDLAGNLYSSVDLKSFTNLNKGKWNQIFNLLEFNGLLWIATNSGIHNHNPLSNEITRNNNGISKQYGEILGFTKVDNGLLAYGNNYIYKLQNNKWEKQDYKSKYVISHVLSDDLNLYINTTGEGVTQINKKDKLLNKKLEIGSRPDSLFSSNFIFFNDGGIAALQDNFILDTKSKGKDIVTKSVLTSLWQGTNYLLAGTADEGIWKTSLGGVAETRSVTQPLLSTFPNPTFDKSISVQIEGFSPINQLTIIDEAGRVVKKEQNLAEKIYSFTANSAGCYRVIMEDKVNRLVKMTCFFN